MRHVDIRQIMAAIFTGATCQKDIDARLGDFIAALAAEGVSAKPGRTLFHPKKIVGLDLWTFTAAPDVVLVGLP